MTSRILAAVLAAALSAPALAQPPAAAQPAASPRREAPPAPATPKDVKLPARRTFALENGLQVTLVPFGEMPRVHVSLSVRTGNAHESLKETWLADLTADMLQEGTATRSAEQLAQEAAHMGGELGTTVTPDETVVGATVLSESGPALVGLVADVVQHPSFPGDAFARVRTDFVRRLALMRSQPQVLSQERFLAALYPGHPFGRMAPTEAQLKGYTLEQVRGFWDAQYGAVRSHLFVTGRFDAAAVEAAVREAFGGWRRGTPPATVLPRPSTKRALHVVNRPGAVQSSIYMGLPVVHPGHPDAVKLLVTNALLGGSFSSRITTNIREQKGYTYSPHSLVSSHYKDAYWAQVADVTTSVTGPSLKEIFREIDRLQAEPPSEEELRAIKAYLVGTFTLQVSSREGLAGRLRFQRLHELPEDALETYVQQVMAVTAADVQQVARQYLQEEKMTVVVVGDRKVIEPQLAPFGPLIVAPAL